MEVKVLSQFPDCGNWMLERGINLPESMCDCGVMKRVVVPRNFISKSVCQKHGRLEVHLYLSELLDESAVV